VVASAHAFTVVTYAVGVPAKQTLTHKTSATVWDVEGFDKEVLCINKRINRHSRHERQLMKVAEFSARHK